MPKDAELVLFDGGANTKLAQNISLSLNVPLGEIEIGTFSDGEILVKINTNVRGKDVFVIQPLVTPYSDNIMRLLLIIDALKRASAKRITSVIPYYAYSRQEKKTRGREPISAKLLANIITKAGSDRIMTMDLHAAAIQGFFDIPVDHLTAVKLLAEYFIEKKLEDCVVISPDAGGTARAREFARILQANLAIIDKRRPKPNETEIMNIIGDVSDKDVIMVDDIIDTAGTVVNGAKALYENGAKRVFVVCTHAILSGPAVKRLNDSDIIEIVTTDTVPIVDKNVKGLKIISVASLLSEAIYRVHNDYSISEVFR